MGEAKVGLVNQRGGLQGAVAEFAPQVGFGDAMQFVVDERNEVVEGLAVAAADAREKLGDRGRAFALSVNRREKERSAKTLPG